ncbi:hypothetical protein CKK33_05820 [Mucilaginibacter sp. MD40]|uniref:cupin domain-containing protein n=1 Tax=Mucilaginibacter sp. MD40 TaxID=2029590 RepID=UPI000BACE730|nr:cupin domain-containing protein [Mucilaginibacter sp. MD40]PAW93037.1 hypothetical protein CKK33_05820 [Mucilaginibacter sp. MD40]
MNNLFNFILSPIPDKQFFNEYWDQAFLNIKRNDADYYKNIIDLKDINHFLSKQDTRFPSIRVARNGLELPFIEYTDIDIAEDSFAAPIINTDKLFNCFYEGATIVLQRMKYSLESLSNFTAELERLLNFRTETNIFITPENAKGFNAHYDNHNVVILQLYGKKTWNLYDINKKQPILSESYKQLNYEGIEPCKVIELLPGDLLYIPRGMVHEAVTVKESSVHLTLGLFPDTWADVFRSALSSIKNEEILSQQIFTPTDIAKKETSDEYLKMVKSFLDNLEF